MPSEQPGIGRLVGFIAIFTVIGVPIVAYLWETLNQILALEASAAQVGLAIVGLAVFIAFLTLLARQVRRMHPTRE